MKSNSPERLHLLLSLQLQSDLMNISSIFCFVTNSKSLLFKYSISELMSKVFILSNIHEEVDQPSNIFLPQPLTSPETSTIGPTYYHCFLPIGKNFKEVKTHNNNGKLPGHTVCMAFVNWQCIKSVQHMYFPECHTSFHKTLSTCIPLVTVFQIYSMLWI